MHQEDGTGTRDRTEDGDAKTTIQPTDSFTANRLPQAIEKALVLSAAVRLYQALDPVERHGYGPKADARTHPRPEERIPLRLPLCVRRSWDIAHTETTRQLVRSIPSTDLPSA